MFKKFIISQLLLVLTFNIYSQTNKPILHGKHWIAITGKPIGATAGSIIFEKGGNAVDAACAMVAATATMWDVLGWGGETQALIYNPNTKKVIGINALGVAPSGATPDFYREKGYSIPPKFGPLSAVTPGTPGGIMTMLAEYGTMSLETILYPAMEMAKGYPIEAQAAGKIIIASNNGGMTETIKEGEDNTGFRIRNNDMEDLKNKINIALNLNNDELNNLRKRAIEHVDKNFSLENMCKKTLDVYDRILNVSKK